MKLNPGPYLASSKTLAFSRSSSSFLSCILPSTSSLFSLYHLFRRYVPFSLPSFRKMTSSGARPRSIRAVQCSLVWGKLSRIQPPALWRGMQKMKILDFFPWEIALCSGPDSHFEAWATLSLCSTGTPFLFHFFFIMGGCLHVHHKAGQPLHGEGFMYV